MASLSTILLMLFTYQTSGEIYNLHSLSNSNLTTDVIPAQLFVVRGLMIVGFVDSGKVDDHYLNFHFIIRYYMLPPATLSLCVLFCSFVYFVVDFVVDNPFTCEFVCHCTKSPDTVCFTVKYSVLSSVNNSTGSSEVVFALSKFLVISYYQYNWDYLSN